METGNDVLRVRVIDGIATAVLNRPDAMNSIDPSLRAALHEFWAQIDQDEEIKVVVLTGAGERAFCAGADLKKTMPPPESHAFRTFGTSEPDHLLHGLRTDKPIICAINGYAIAGGLELALACDIRIASRNAEFGLAEVRVGSIPGAGGTYRLPRIVGPSVAMQMLLTGDRISAEEALRVGLISELHEPDGLAARAQDIARRIAANAPLSVRAVKRLVAHGADAPRVVGLDLERFVWGLLRDSEDRIEGRRAFQEKREPRYHGR